MDWMKYKKIYFSVSLFFISLSVFGLVKWGLNLGVDFTGGSVIEYRFDKEISTEDLTQKLKNSNYEVKAIQNAGAKNYLLKFAPLNQNTKGEIINLLKDDDNYKGEELKYESVGPTIGPELLKKTLYAIAISAVTILLWVAYQFKNIKFGVSAIIAMLHDSLILIGIYSILGKYFNAEADFLFFTALLTILSFSVHDTIVVYDRIREAHKKVGGDLYGLANKAVSETMVRSLNNSFTIIFMLLALLLMGGSTIKWFAVALFIGTISGTYSSPFVAVPILVSWDEISRNIKLRKIK
jgi:preprotein translocase subunit SecF